LTPPLPEGLFPIPQELHKILIYKIRNSMNKKICELYSKEERVVMLSKEKVNQSRKSKDRKYNCQKKTDKKTSNDLQSTT
jgi:hypothetical protein